MHAGSSLGLPAPAILQKFKEPRTSTTKMCKNQWEEKEKNGRKEILLYFLFISIRISVTQQAEQKEISKQVERCFRWVDMSGTGSGRRERIWMSVVPGLSLLSWAIALWMSTPNLLWGAGASCGCGKVRVLCSHLNSLLWRMGPSLCAQWCTKQVGGGVCKGGLNRWRWADSENNEK